MAQPDKSELIIPNERVLDLATARRLPIDIEGSVTYELVLTIWAVFSEKDTATAQDLGPEWLAGVAAATPADLSEELKTLGGPGQSSWLAISALMLSAPHPHSPERVYDWLAGIEDGRLRRWLLSAHSHDESQALIEQAAEGDLDAVREVLGEWGEKHPELIEHLEWVVSTEGLPGRYSAALHRFREEVFSEYEDDFAAAIARAAAARRASPNRGTAREVIEEVTSGIDFDVPIGVSRLVLVPSMVTRPLSLIDVHRGTLIVYYGLADEFIDTDPEAPPSWLVRTYKALSDDKRLRILRRLAEGETTLDELSDMLGISKSTVHHHISILRAAGLVRVLLPTEEQGKKYRSFGLRPQGLGDAEDFLDSYLGRQGDPTHA